MKRNLGLILILITLFTVTLFADNKAPDNIIILITDGMSLSNKTITRIFTVGPYGRMNMDKMDITGYMTNHSSNSWISDSAANSSAISMGVKTDNNRVSVLPNGKIKTNFFEKISLINKKTGIVTNGPVTSPALAPYYSHTEHFRNESIIAEDIFRKNINLIFGGGEKAFLPQAENGIRTDGKNFIEESQRLGYRFLASAKAFRDFNYSEKILGLFGRDFLPYELDRSDEDVSLYEMTKKAINILNSGKEGFVLLIENFNINRALDALDVKAAVAEIDMTDKITGMILDFIKENPETLFLMISGYDTGGLVVTDSLNTHVYTPLKTSTNALGKRITATGANIDQIMAVYAGINLNDFERQTIQSGLNTDFFDRRIGFIMASKAGILTLPPSSSNLRSGTVTPIWAHGKHSEFFNGFNDNTEVGDLIIRILGVK
ncbi:MAG: alkaline phosphatase [Candidatus Muiribacteriota bacterium]